MPMISEWIPLDDGSFVRVDEHNQVVAEVFADDEIEGGWIWVANAPDAAGWGFECPSAEIGRHMADASLWSTGYEVNLGVLPEA